MQSFRNDDFLSRYGAAPLLGARFTTSGAAVDRWRSLLNQDITGRYPVAPTGAWDSALEAATRKFQADNGLKVDGIVGPDTMAVMEYDPRVISSSADGVPRVSLASIGGAISELFAVNPLAHIPQGDPAPVIGTAATPEQITGPSPVSAPAKTGLIKPPTEDKPASRLDQELWKGGATLGQALGGLGVAAGLVVAGLALRSASSPSHVPAVGQPNRGRRNDCGCGR